VGELGRNMGDAPELVTLGEAQRRLGVSHTTMARLVKEGRFTLYRNPLDGRQKLVDAQELDEFLQPERVTERRVRPDNRVRLRRSNELLVILREAERTGPPAPFVVTRDAVVHPAFPDGEIPTTEDVFNRLIAEGYVRVLTGIIHRVGTNVGREFTITDRGREEIERLASGRRGMSRQD
jgi:excisionase family DNA binding protein